jgi:hypothetical protein
MKHLTVITSWLSLASAATVAKPQKVSYDGYKVFRVSVGDQVAKVNDVVSSLGLTTWKGAPKAGAFADIVVPPTKIDAFADRIAGLDATTMHDDLGASIAEESNFHVYAGVYRAERISDETVHLRILILTCYTSRFGQQHVVQLVPRIR